MSADGLCVGEPEPLNVIAEHDLSQVSSKVVCVTVCFQTRTSVCLSLVSAARLSVRTLEEALRVNV